MSYPSHLITLISLSYPAPLLFYPALRVLLSDPTSHIFLLILICYPLFISCYPRYLIPVIIPPLLLQPGEYLEHPSLAIEDPGEIPATFPDLAIGYKLHLECPRLINVFDWLTCWNSIGGWLEQWSVHSV